MSKIEVLQAASCVREASSLLAKVGEILPCAEDIVEGWRYPIVDELDGIASFMENQLCVDNTVFVTPAKEAIACGWDRPDKFQWPGKVVFELKTHNDIHVYQFLLFDKHNLCYVLKGWRADLLEVVK